MTADLLAELLLALANAAQLVALAIIGRRQAQVKQELERSLPPVR